MTNRPKTTRRRPLRDLVKHLFGNTTKGDLYQDKIIRFLLGSLPEKDRARIEERLLEDDEFFEQVVATEQELLDAYANGAFSPVEAAYMRRVYGRSPVRARRARIAQLISARWHAKGKRQAPVAEPVFTREQELVAATYLRVRHVATRLLQREPATEISVTDLVHEVYLRMLGAKADRWRDHNQFIAVATQVMRQQLVARARVRKQKSSSAAIASLFGVTSSDAQLQDALNRLAEVNPRESLVVELYFFAGMTSREIAAILAVSERAVERDAMFARSWLRTHLAARTP
jgi:RNA polymerase sigma factor (TIGR02999 family)